MVSYVILLYPVPLHSIVRYCVVGFGARAVSRKTPKYFILYEGWQQVEIEDKWVEAAASIWSFKFSSTLHRIGGKMICQNQRRHFGRDNQRVISPDASIPCFLNTSQLLSSQN